jgi:hypothetical protein
MRKIHFDYERAAIRNHSEAKPTIHMQVCGELLPQLRQLGYRSSDLQSWFPWLEKPRVPTLPVSLALLLNWLLLEFQSDPIAQRIVKNREWRNLVARAEREILGPYFEACATFFQAPAQNDSNLFVESVLYEKRA